MLAIDPEYFSITGGRERWLYRVARKHAGGAGERGFAISLPTLFEKSGAEGTYRRFKFEMQKLVRRDDLPGIGLTWEEEEGKEPRIRMRMRDGTLAAADEEPVRRDASSPTARRRRPVPAPAPLLLHAQLGEDTIARIRRDFPGWDIYAMKAEFDGWIAEDADRRPADYQGAFYGFMRRHHERNRP